jgi:AcrR family transcriptional regulator
MDLKERIIESASILFFREGVKSMTMSDIANELGISKRTLYEVFRDKEDLLGNCFDVHIAKADNAINDLTNQTEDVIDSLMQLYSQFLNQMHSFNRSVVHDLRKYHPQLYKKLEQRQKENVYTLLPLLNKGVKQGLIRSDVNFEIILWLVRIQFRALMNYDYLPLDKYSINEFIHTIILNFIRGIATASGNERVDNIINNLNTITT